MALSPTTTEFAEVDEGQEFSESVSYNDVEAGEPDPETGEPGEGTSTPVTIESVISSIEDPSITIEISENTVTITGPYNNAFPGKTFKYIPLGQPGSLITVPFNEIPSEIDALTGYNPVGVLSTTVTYTVTTSAGSATITQVVNNNWDAGKAQMLNALSRGQY
jgi:hypothetical protein